MSLPEILALRLQSHGLTGEGFATPDDFIRHMGAIQAQDIPQAMRGIGSRITHSTKGSIKEALSKGKIVRTWPMRGTLHYVAPEHVHWMLDLCASKTVSGFKKRREFLGISDKDAENALAIMMKVLKGGRSLTRTALGEALKDGGIPMQTQRVYHLACYAATKKLICFGPPTEKEETFVLLDERIPHHTTLTRDEQLSELAKMYITSHGPATVDDLARRCGLGKTDCKKAISLVEDQFHTITYQDKIYYYKPRNKTASSKGILLLGGFDEYFLGYKDRSIVADIEHHGKLFTTNGIFFPLIVINGKVVGSWKRTFKKDSVEIAVSALPGSNIPMPSLNEQAERYAKFWGVKDYKIII